MADPVIAGLRADRRRAVLELARVLARHADWHLMTTWRPRALACEEIGSSRDPSRPLSVSAYKAARRVLEDRGYLGLASPAWVPFLRVGAPEQAACRRCSCSPSAPETRTPLPWWVSPGKSPRSPVRRTGCKAPRARDGP